MQVSKSSFRESITPEMEFQIIEEIRKDSNFMLYELQLLKGKHKPNEYILFCSNPKDIDIKEVADKFMKPYLEKYDGRIDIVDVNPIKQELKFILK